MVDHTIEAHFEVTSGAIAGQQAVDAEQLTLKSIQTAALEQAAQEHEDELRRRAIPAMAAAIEGTSHHMQSELEAMKIFNAFLAMQKVFAEMEGEAKNTIQDRVNEIAAALAKQADEARAADLQAQLAPAAPAVEFNPFAGAPNPDPASLPAVPPAPPAPPAEPEFNPFQAPASEPTAADVQAERAALAAPDPLDPFPAPHDVPPAAPVDPGFPAPEPDHSFTLPEAAHDAGMPAPVQVPKSE